MVGSISKNKLLEYNNKGWVWLENQVDIDTINVLKEKAAFFRTWVENDDWKGVGCAGKHDQFLYEFYTSNLMYTLASTFLGVSDIWLFNDQIVVKNPGDNFFFPAHTDNDTVDPNKDYNIDTINLSIILDDFTDENGGLELFSSEWEKVYPKKGDIVAIRGNTLHRSGVNKSSSSRGLYACVYCADKIDFLNFYKDKFVI